MLLTQIKLIDLTVCDDVDLATQGCHVSFDSSVAMIFTPVANLLLTVPPETIYPFTEVLPQQINTPFSPQQ